MGRPTATLWRWGGVLSYLGPLSGWSALLLLVWPNTWPAQVNKSSRSWPYSCLLKSTDQPLWTPEFCSMATAAPTDCVLDVCCTCHVSQFQWFMNMRKAILFKYVEHIENGNHQLRSEPARSLPSRWHVEQRILFYIQKSFKLRLSCMSGTYCNGDSRKLILETLAWSFNCLSGPSAKKTYNLIKTKLSPPPAQVWANTPLQIHGEQDFPRSTALRDGQWPVGELLVAMWECCMESRVTRIS